MSSNRPGPPDRPPPPPEHAPHNALLLLEAQRVVTVGPRCPRGPGFPGVP